jgi:cyclopropane fatty-acyl-phospholipid synthase-like methyltransferase
MDCQVNADGDVALWSHYQINDTDAAFDAARPRLDALYGHIRRLSPSGRLLEIGFGDGYLLRRLAEHYECHGADISEENVQRMAAKVPNATFATVTVDGKLPYAENSFDLFVASEVLEHMDDAELETTVSEIHRVLKPGGRAVVSFPARENLKELESFCPNCGNIFHKWGHKQRWDRAKIERLFGRFSIEGVSERFFIDKRLNWFGKIAGIARIGISKVRPTSGMTFLVTLRK